jgi:hypothetical protein
MNETTNSNGLPKGYLEQINRLRGAQMEREQQELRDQRKMRGEEYDKMKLAKMRPPNFKEPSKRKLLFYVDVNITPTK